MQDNNSTQQPAQHYASPNSNQPQKKSAKAIYLKRFFILLAAAVFSLTFSFLAANIYKQLNRDRLPTSQILSTTEIDDDTIDSHYPDISQEIKDLANRLELTIEGKRLFYEYQPEIFETDSDPDYLCNKNVKVNWRVTISGCWSIQNTKKIYLLRNSNLETSAAHELLHAAYYDLYIHGKHETIEEDVITVFNQHNEELKKLINVYDSLHGDKNTEFKDLSVYNELHSFIGSQIEEIPQGLEEHYTRYFNDRQKIVSFFENN